MDKGTFYITRGISSGSSGTPITELTAIVKSSTEVDLTWLGGSAKIERSTDGVTFTEIGTGSNSYSDSGLTAGTLYYYRVKKGTQYSAVIDVYVSTLLSGLLEFWKFDESSGDAVGVKGNVLTNVNGAAYAAGKNGNAVSLGSNNTNKNLQLNNTLGLNYNSPFSISLWIKGLTQPAGNSAVISVIFATNPGNYIVVKRDGNNLCMSDGSSIIAGLSTTNSTHIVITRDHAGNSIKYYVNGVYKSSEASFTGNYLAQTSRISLGNFTNVMYSSLVFEDFGIFDRLLTTAEINELFYAGSAKLHPFDNRKVIADNVSYCWFTSPKLIYNSTAKKTWIGVVSINDNNEGKHSILELDHTTGQGSICELGVTNKDDHNEPSILIRASDNRLFAAYCGHAGAYIKYRLSTNALDASAWGAESTLNPHSPNGYTYANAFQAANGNIYIFYRDTGVDAIWAYVKSTDDGATFGAHTLFSFKTYHRIYQDQSNKNIIHFLASHHANEYALSLQINHFYFDATDDTFHLSNGTDVTANLPLTDTHETPIMLNVLNEGGWIEDLIVDSDGYPRVLLTHYDDVVSDPSNKYLYYSEWNGSVWSTPHLIHKSVSRTMQPTGTQIHYPPLACFDRNNPNRIFASKEINSICEIFLLTRVAADNFTSIQKTFNSLYDQWRPMTTKAPRRNVFWLNKRIYTNYENGWYEQLMCDSF